LEAEMLEYIKDPAMIERKSFEIIAEKLDGKLSHLGSIEQNIIKRVVHCSGNLDLWDKLNFSEDFFESFLSFLRYKTVYTDVNMVKSGINKKIIPELQVYCFIDDPEIAELSKEQKISRAYLSMQKALRANPGIFVIGNAPTALFKLLESTEKLFIIGVPVGFVGAAQSKELLVESVHSYVTISGTFGGSNIAAAIMNALLKEAYNAAIR